MRLKPDFMAWKYAADHPGIYLLLSLGAWGFGCELCRLDLHGTHYWRLRIVIGPWCWGWLA